MSFPSDPGLPTARISPAGVLGILLPALTLAATPALDAQTPDRGPLLLELPSSTAELAMGGAFYVSETSSDAVFVSPGVLDRSRGISAALQRYGSRTTLASLSGAAEWWGGGVALGLRSVGFGAASEAPEDLTGDPAAVYAAGPVAVHQLAATAGYGRRLMGIRWGATASLVEQRVGGERDATVAFDLGAAADVGPLTLAVSGHHLGAAMDVGSGTLALPHRGRLAASFRDHALGPLDLGAAGVVSILADGSVRPGAGLEAAYWPVVGRTFIARVGVRDTGESSASAVTFGLAFEGDDIVVEYAREGLDGLDAAHRLGIGFR